MMIFHSDCNQIGFGVTKDAVTIVVDDKAHILDMSVKERVDLGIQLIRSANIRYIDEKPPEIDGQ